MKSLVLFPLSAILFFACNDAATHEGKIETPNDVAEVTTSSVTEESSPSPIAETIAAPVSKPQKVRQKSLNKVPLPLPSDELILPQKPNQAFVFRPDKDTLITCAEGTILRINAKCFIDAQTCEPVLTPIKMEVKEFYKTSDILLAKLSTWANGEILETGGMLHLSASSNDRECVIDDGKFIEITFPTEEKKEGMQLFTGTWTPDNQMNWQVVPGSRDRNEIVKVPDTLASFHYGYDAFASYLNTALSSNNWADSRSSGYSGMISFVVDSTGKILAPVSNQCKSEAFCDDVISAILMYGYMKPAKLKGEAVNSRFFLPVTYRTYNNRCFENRAYMNTSGYKSAEVSFNTPSPAEISDYVMRSNGLGWINCDRFLTWPAEMKKDIYVRQSNKGSVRMDLVFHNYNAVLSSQIGAGGFYFYSIPKGEPVTLIAMKRVAGKTYLAMKRTTTDDDKWDDIEYRAVDIDNYHQELQSAFVAL